LGGGPRSKTDEAYNNNNDDGVKSDDSNREPGLHGAASSGQSAHTTKICSGLLDRRRGRNARRSTFRAIQTVDCATTETASLEGFFGRNSSRTVALDVAAHLEIQSQINQYQQSPILLQHVNCIGQDCDKH
jgi:hypothetical protein